MALWNAIARGLRPGRFCGCPLLLLALLSASAWSEPDAPPSAAPEPPPKRIAPNWILPDGNGNPVSLYQESESGKTTVMFFWATWCKPCKRLMPVIRQLDAAKGDKPVVFYLMNLWESGDAEGFLRSQAIELPAFYQTESVAQRYDIHITPGLVVVGPDRRIQYVRQPNERIPEIAAQLQHLLGITLPPTQEAQASPESSL